MWLLEYARAGFTADGPICTLLFFRVLFAACCLNKFTVETLRGYFRYFDEEAYLSELYSLREERLFRVTPGLYRGLYLAKIPAALLLLAGIQPRLALLVLFASFLVEIQIYFKFHTNWFLLVTASLLLSPDLGKAFTVYDGFSALNALRARGDVFACAPIMLTLSVLYLATAYRKMNPVFLSGAAVWATVQLILEDRGKRKHFDSFGLGPMSRWLLGASDRALARRWRPLMIATIALELAIPVMLWFRPTQPAAMLLGAGMHAGFTLIAPATLLHFSVLTVSSYLLFVDPSLLAISPS